MKPYTALALTTVAVALAGCTEQQTQTYDAFFGLTAAPAAEVTEVAAAAIIEPVAEPVVEPEPVCVPVFRVVECP